MPIFGAVSHMGLMLLKTWERKVITLNIKIRYVKEQNSAVIICYSCMIDFSFQK